MRKPGGYFTIVDPDAPGIVELDTFTCRHCGKLNRVQPMQRAEDLGGHCRICWGLICPACVGKGVCDPLEERILRMERSYHARRHMLECG